jgi:hypothetical protein
MEDEVLQDKDWSEDEEAEGVLLMNPCCQVAPCRSLVSGQELCRDFLHLALHTNSRWHSCKFFLCTGTNISSVFTTVNAVSPNMNRDYR